MSLYTVVFGASGDAEAVVGTLNARQRFDAGRLRDAWIERHGDETVFAVYTRNGGGNREDQADAIDSMHDHPWFRSDDDDEFDSTYATFRFAVDEAWVRTWLTTDTAEGPAVPAEFADAVIAAFAQAQPPVDTSARWTEAIEALRRSTP